MTIKSLTNLTLMLALGVSVVSIQTAAQSLQPGFTLIPHRDTTVPAVPTEADRRRGFQLFSRHWMDAVFDSTVPPRRAPLATLEIFASPGEYEPAAFGLHALGHLSAVRLTVGPLVADNGHRLAAPDLRIARSLAFRWGSDTTAVRVPVILEKRESYTVARGTSRFCWVTVHVLADTPAGMYRTEVTVAVAGRGAVAIALNVQVLPVRLVSAGELDQSYGFWLWHFEAPPPHAPDPVAAFKDMIAHGMNSVHFGTDENIPFVKTDQGYSRSIAGTTWDVFMNAAKQAGFSKPLLVSTDDIASNAGRIFPYTDGVVDLVMTDHLGKWTIKANKLKENPDFEKLFGQGVAQIMAEFKQRGLPEPIFGVGDEMQTYEYYTHGYLDRLIHRAGGKSSANGVGLFPADSTHWRAEATRMTEIIMPGFALSDYHGRTQRGFPEDVVLARQQGKRMMTYNYGSLILPVQATKRFGMGFFFESLGWGCEGQFQHAYFSPYEDPYNLLDYRAYADRCAVFPAIPERNEVGGPTINYESMREGIDDMRYITTLKRLIGRAHDSGHGSDADTAQAGLDSIIGSLDFAVFYARTEAWNEFTPSASYWQRTSPPLDPAKAGETQTTWQEPVKYVDGTLRYPNGWSSQDYDNARWDIAQKIIKLQDVLTGKN